MSNENGESAQEHFEAAAKELAKWSYRLADATLRDRMPHERNRLARKVRMLATELDEWWQTDDPRENGWVGSDGRP